MVTLRFHREDGSKLDLHPAAIAGYGQRLMADQEVGGELVLAFGIIPVKETHTQIGELLDRATAAMHLAGAGVRGRG